MIICTVKEIFYLKIFLVKKQIKRLVKSNCQLHIEVQILINDLILKLVLV